MPPHQGHLNLIKYGQRHCDELVVAVCSRPTEPIDGKLRLHWLREIFEGKNIQFVGIKANLPQDKKSARQPSKIWSQYLLKRFGHFDKIFSSEKYGDYLAEFMGAKHYPLDLKRSNIPVSGTLIRNNPYKYWSFIPEVVRPYFITKICCFGPESTGKTTLAKNLADQYQTLWVPEYARQLISQQNNKFVYGDMAKFSRGQLAKERKAIMKANKLLFLDTDYLTTLIYSRHYFGKIPRYVQHLADTKQYDLYLFCDIDLPWQEDPQRDLGHRRQEFKKIFQKELKKRAIPYTMISGLGKKRLANAISVVDNYLKNTWPCKLTY